MNCSDNMSNDVGTILFGKEAVDAGIIDAVGGVSQALGELRRRVAKVDELEKMCIRDRIMPLQIVRNDITKM